MIAAIPSIVTDTAALVGAFTVIVGGFGVLARVPPLRWLFRTIIAQPLGRWFRNEVAEATADIAERTAATEHLVTYHLGTNDTTMPWHVRFSRLEVKHGLEPAKQQPEEHA